MKRKLIVCLLLGVMELQLTACSFEPKCRGDVTTIRLKLK